MTEITVDTVADLIITVAGTLMLWYWIRMQVQRMKSVSRILSISVIPLRLEMLQGQLYCWNHLTNDFVCQGLCVQDIYDHLTKYRPDQMPVIAHADSCALIAIEQYRRKHGNLLHE